MSKNILLNSGTKGLHVLIVAPLAPPKNSPEAMQVGRFLDSADPSVRFTLVTTPVTAGWERADKSLTLKRQGTRIITLGLPFHRFTQRVLGNHRLAQLHVPDEDFWLPWLARRVLSGLEERPDVIYSRSAPFSAALLAKRLKELLGLPWMMHLSDPWSDSPYRHLSPGLAAIDRRLEATCFRYADRIALTTEGQAAHYRALLPRRAGDIVVTTNMMPVEAFPALKNCTGLDAQPLRLVYTGALYGAREPSVILAAMRLIHERFPAIRGKVAIDFYGNMSSVIADEIDGVPGCRQHGAVSFDTAVAAQAAADVLLAIEPDGPSPLLRHFMPSKNLDYMAQSKPILALTPQSSETERLCAAGHGWAVAPHDREGLANRIVALADVKARGRPLFEPTDLDQSPFRALKVTADIVAELTGLVANCEKKR